MRHIRQRNALLLFFLEFLCFKKKFFIPIGPFTIYQRQSAETTTNGSHIIGIVIQKYSYIRIKPSGCQITPLQPQPQNCHNQYSTCRNIFTTFTTGLYPGEIWSAKASKPVFTISNAIINPNTVNKTA